MLFYLFLWWVGENVERINKEDKKNIDEIQILLKITGYSSMSLLSRLWNCDLHSSGKNSSQLKHYENTTNWYQTPVRAAGSPAPVTTLWEWGSLRFGRPEQSCRAPAP